MRIYLLPQEFYLYRYSELEVTAEALLLKYMNSGAQLYRYAWKNCEEREKLFNLVCRVKVWLPKNSAMVEFENGQRECVSRNALRKVLTNSV
jgi:hypothetical protein